MCLAIPGKIIELADAENNLVKVDVSGIKRVINVQCILDEEHSIDSCIGDWVLIHVGFAMSRIDEAEARKTIEVLDEMGELIEQMQEMQSMSHV